MCLNHQVNKQFNFKFRISNNKKKFQRFPSLSPISPGEEVEVDLVDSLQVPKNSKLKSWSSVAPWENQTYNKKLANDRSQVGHFCECFIPLSSRNKAPTNNQTNHGFETPINRNFWERNVVVDQFQRSTRKTSRTKWNFSVPLKWMAGKSSSIFLDCRW